MSYGNDSGSNNKLKGGYNTNFAPANIGSCTRLDNIQSANYINKITKSNTFMYGYEDGNNKYYGCKSDTLFSDTEDDKNIVWKKMVYTFPKVGEYVYTKDVSKDICSIYGLNQCSQEEIKYRQNCACGWVSDNDNPVFWADKDKACDSNTVKKGINACTKQKKAYTYCCGVLDKKYSKCPDSNPYPVSSTNPIPIHGGVFGGKNNFCCNSDNNEKGDCNGSDIETAIEDKNAVPCINPPCIEKFTNSGVHNQEYIKYILYFIMLLIIICIYTKSSKI
jgi:hypothetical protein